MSNSLRHQCIHSYNSIRCDQTTGRSRNCFPFYTVLRQRDFIAGITTSRDTRTRMYVRTYEYTYVYDAAAAATFHCQCLLDFDPSQSVSLRSSSSSSSSQVCLLACSPQFIVPTFKVLKSFSAAPLSLNHSLGK